MSSVSVRWIDTEPRHIGKLRHYNLLESHRRVGVKRDVCCRARAVLTPLVYRPLVIVSESRPVQNVSRLSASSTSMVGVGGRTV